MDEKQQNKEQITSAATRDRPRFTTILLVIGSIIVAGLAFSAFQRNETVTESPEERTEENQPPPDGTSINPDTSTWETYISREQDFSIRYPPGTRIVENQDNSVSFLIIGPSQRENTEFYDGLNLTISEKPLNNSTLEEVARQDAKTVSSLGEIIDEVNSTTLNETEGYSYRAQSLGNFTKYFLPVTGTDQFIEISDSTVDPTNAGYAEVAERMLNTIEITPLETTDET